MKSARAREAIYIIAILAVASLYGCSEGPPGFLDPGSNSPPPLPDPDSNSPPSLSGSPATSVTINDSYSFTPSASDPDGDTLIFSIQNTPHWAAFDTFTGQLSGMPFLGDSGTYSGIVISVSDGVESASLPTFTVTVNQVSLGSVSLSWTPPTQNEDGSPLTDLAGYRIYSGDQQGVYTDSVQIDNPGISTYVVEGLSIGTHYFVSTAFNSQGVESAFSNEAVKVAN